MTVNQGSSKKVVLALAIVWLGHFLVDFMIGIWPVHKTIMQLDIATVGIMSTIGVVIGEGTQLLFGSLSDGGYRRSVILGGLLATTAATGYAFTDNYYSLFLLLLMTCLGSGAFHPAAMSIVGSLPSIRKGLFFTIFASGGMAGMASSQIIYTLFHGSPLLSTVMLAVPTIILLIIVMVSRVAESQKLAIEGERRVGISAIKKFFSDTKLRYVYIMQVCNQSIFWGTVFLLPDLLSSRGYEAWISFGGGHLAFTSGCMLLMIPAGYLADKMSPQKILMAAPLVGIVLFYSILLSPTLPAFALLGLLFCLGAAVGVTSPLTIAYGNILMPGNPGVVGAILLGMAWVIAESVGIGGGGVLTRLFVDDAPAKSLAVLGSAFFFSVLSCYMVQKQQHKEVAVA
ncbi:MAG: MFS transporter [Chlamydiota bacterium]|nr:MFS transporter [Chlamydiota bacterium]